MAQTSASAVSPATADVSSVDASTVEELNNKIRDNLNAKAEADAAEKSKYEKEHAAYEAAVDQNNSAIEKAQREQAEYNTAKDKYTSDLAKWQSKAAPKPNAKADAKPTSFASLPGQKKAACDYEQATGSMMSVRVCH